MPFCRVSLKLLLFLLWIQKTMWLLSPTYWLLKDIFHFFQVIICGCFQAHSRTKCARTKMSNFWGSGVSALSLEAVDWSLSSPLTLFALLCVVFVSLEGMSSLLSTAQWAEDSRRCCEHTSPQTHGSQAAGAVQHTSPQTHWSHDEMILWFVCLLFALHVLAHVVFFLLHLAWLFPRWGSSSGWPCGRQQGGGGSDSRGSDTAQRSGAVWFLWQSFSFSWICPSDLNRDPSSFSLQSCRGLFSKMFPSKCWLWT